MSTRRKPQSFPWATFADDELLDLRFCDLDLKLSATHLQKRIEALYGELRRRELRFRPHCWLSEEWFSPDGIPGIAIPFYLAHPRLVKLEYRQMFDVEGGTDRYCMQLLRHETGHAIDTAYRLHRRKRWKQLFGNPNKPYPDHYTPRPQSRRFVHHLDWWYAQSHPTEDFAETFAVWLQPRTRWRQLYKGWPALKKLVYLDEVMHSIEGKPPPVRSRKRVEPLSRIRRTLRDHYEEKRARYQIDVPEVYDGDLRRLFADSRSSSRQKASAAAFLRRSGPDLCHLCSRGTGETPYSIAQILREMIVRCREMDLRINRPLEDVRVEVAVFLCVQTVNYLHKAHHKIPM